jgi:hypothetical protein
VIRIFKIIFFSLLLSLHSLYIAAQHERTQYPFFLSDHTYFEASVSYIGNHFSNLQLENGFRAESIDIPHVGVRLMLYGYRFTKNLSGQLSYMRPVLWIKYRNINGDHGFHSVPTNVAGVSMKYRSQINERISLYGEAGLGIITRSGFNINNIPAVKNANYFTLLASGGLEYRLNKNLNLVAGLGWSPANAKVKQPATVFVTGGLTYNIHKLSEAKVSENKNSGYIFHKNLLQVGYTSNVLGYGVNNFFANKIFPIFWGGDVQVKSGISLHYQRNVFHGKKVFSFDWGASLSYWKSKIMKEGFYTISLFPLLRFTAFHFKKSDLYFNYSVAGPTYISKIKIDNIETGKHFTFQDFMGMGIYAGKKRNINAEIRIAHYSNGDLFPDNNGVMVPLTINMGYAF